jgi:hypothetical protein
VAHRLIAHRFLAWRSIVAGADGAHAARLSTTKICSGSALACTELLRGHSPEGRGSSRSANSVEDVLEHRTSAELKGLAQVIHPQKLSKKERLERWALSLEKRKGARLPYLFALADRLAPDRRLETVPVLRLVATLWAAVRCLAGF